MKWLLAFFAVAAAWANEQAAYDVGGRITSLLSNEDDVGIATNVVAVLPNGKRVRLQRRGEDAHRQGGDLKWSLHFELPDGGHGVLNLQSQEDAGRLRYTTAIEAQSALDVSAIEFVVDLPHDVFVKGAFRADDAAAIPLAVARPAAPALFSGNSAWLHFSNSSGDRSIDAGFGQPTPVSIVDRWDGSGRSFQLRALILKGPVASGAKASLTTSLQLTEHVPPPPPVHVAIDPAKTLYPFDGFGGDYCWDTRSPIAKYTLDNLKVGWARTEMKLLQWDKHRDAPAPEVRGDLELMQQLQRRGVPFVISVWWLPERFYTDAYEKPRSAHFRLIDPDKWDELLDLIGGYLLYAKREYQVEPDLFSFNEANIGIYVGLTPEAHLQAIKRIGAHFRKLGLKTRMLLGDATGPRDTHKFVLEAAADPEALQYVGAVGFHSWGGGSHEQYAAWGDVAEWLHLPLLVTEVGVDASAYHNRAYDSFHYGLQEARMIQELLQYARPQGTQFWQFTNDYALVHTGPDGAIQPTGRFWLMKQFTDLTPRHSDAIAAVSDQPDVFVTAFHKGDATTIHILNTGASRTVQISGLPQATWRVFETTETQGYQQSSGTTQLTIPAKSLVTMVSP